MNTMNNFNYTSEGFEKACEWANNIVMSNGIKLIDYVNGSFKNTEEKLHFINNYKLKHG